MRRPTWSSDFSGGYASGQLCARKREHADVDPRDLAFWTAEALNDEITLLPDVPEHVRTDEELDAEAEAEAPAPIPIDAGQDPSMHTTHLLQVYLRHDWEVSRRGGRPATFCSVDAGVQHARCAPDVARIALVLDS
jgi:hypothetical protein